MPIFKFKNKNNQVTLDKLIIEDITDDKRTSIIPKQSFLHEDYKIDNNIYMVINQMFFKMSKMFTKKVFHCILIREGNNKIFIMPDKSYVFWNGTCINPLNYELNINGNIEEISQQINDGTLKV